MPKITPKPDTAQADTAQAATAQAATPPPAPAPIPWPDPAALVSQCPPERLPDLLAYAQRIAWLVDLRWQSRS